MNPKTDTKTLILALHKLAGEIYSEDGVAQALIKEAADHLEWLTKGSSC